VPLFSSDPISQPSAELIQRVYAYVAYRLGPGPDADDATSEVFERAFRYRDRFDPRRGTPASWLIGIARNYLEQHPPINTSASELPDTAASDDLEEDAVRRLWVARLVAQLEERDRELIALRYGADLTAGQIADLIGLTPNAVAVALHRAVARLRDMLDAERADEIDRDAVDAEARSLAALPDPRSSSG